MSIDTEATHPGGQIPPMDELARLGQDLAGAMPVEAQPHVVGETGNDTAYDGQFAAVAETGEADRSTEVFKLTRNTETYEVTVESELTLADYEKLTPPDVWSLLKKWSEPLKDKTVTFINPTMEGGGVAMLRPTVVHMLKQLGVDAHWFVMEKPNPEDPKVADTFKFTKQMHNISQRQAGDGRIDEAGKAMHHAWAVDQNWPVLQKQDAIKHADFMVFDDPQPAPLIRLFKEINPTAVVGWRNHIDTDGDLMADPTTPQGEVASYLLNECGIADVDFAIAHPNPKFPHKPMDNKTYFAPATIDAFDNLNRHLTDAEVEGGIDFINAEIAKKNKALVAAGRYADVQPMISTDSSKKRITLVARFDESKGMDKAMELGVRTRKLIREKLRHDNPRWPDERIEKELPEVVLVGNGSVDDPSGPMMFEKMLGLRREKYPDEKHGITVMRLKHNYDAINALMRRSSILMQTSDAEGLETRISDGRKHGLPVVISNRGGMFTQIPEGVREGSRSACILDYDKPDKDLDKGAQFTANLLTNPDEYTAAVQETLEQARDYNQVEFSTVANVIRFLRIFNRNLAHPGGEADKTWLMSDMVAEQRRRTTNLGYVAVA